MWAAGTVSWILTYVAKMGASLGCAGGRAATDSEVEEWLAPYLGTWVVKGAAGYVKDGYRDRVTISKNRFGYYMSFFKYGDTSETGGYWVGEPGRKRWVGSITGRRMPHYLRFGKSPDGEMWWDGFGSHVDVPIDSADPDKFTMQLQITMFGSKCAIEFQRSECSQVPVSAYSGRHIVGISGCAGANVDQITLHYSDGTEKSHGSQGPNPRTHRFDPAVDGHIVMVQWDEEQVYMGNGFKFFLSGGKVITVDGEGCNWRKNDRAKLGLRGDAYHTTRTWKGPSPSQKPYALLDLTCAEGANANGRPIPNGGVWQELPPPS